MIESRKYFLEIRIETENFFIIHKSPNGSCSIRSNSRKFFKFIGIIRKYSLVFLGDYFRGFEHIAGSRIVSESLIVWKEFLIRSICERFDCRKNLQNIVIISDNSFHLCLLE